MTRIKEIVIEADNPSRLARFWAAVLDDFDLRGYDQQEVDRLASIGRTPDTDPSVAVDGPGLTIFFHETSRPRTERGRIHLDLIGNARSEEVDRVVGLGAVIKVLKDDYTVLQDPEGNEFCIQDPDRDER